MAVLVKQRVDIEVCLTTLYITETLEIASGSPFYLFKHKLGQRKCYSAIFVHLKKKKKKGVGVDYS